MPANPTVSVVMTTFNEKEFVEGALESIIEQTFEDWELIVVDDGSKDGTLDLIRDYADQDDRIQCIAQKHRGRAKVLNRGLEEAEGRFIAIQDADDRAVPSRLEKQIDYLTRNENFDIVGGHIRFVQMADGEEWVHRVPLTDNGIRSRAVKRMPFNHTTIMFRSEVATAVDYPEGDYHKDYLFCVRALQRFTGANIDDVLVDVYRHEGSITQTNQRRNYRRALRTRYSAIRSLQPESLAYIYLFGPLLKWAHYELRQVIAQRGVKT